MKQHNVIFASAAVLVLLGGCSSYYYETRAHGSGQYWTGGGAYTVGYRDRCGELPKNGEGYSYYGRYRHDDRPCERDTAVKSVPNPRSPSTPAGNPKGGVI